MQSGNSTEIPFLTIGIASYNYAKYLPKAFNAIKNQSFKDYEVLYCDDGSTDNSVTVIRQLINNNHEMRIRLIEGANVGVMGNKNRILDNAKGKYLMICDADDEMLPECLSVLCQKAIETDADQVVGAFQQTDENGDIIQIQELPSKPIKWTWGAHHATIYKMKIIQDNHIFFDKKAFPDDVYFNMIFHKYSGNTEFINKVVYSWNMHSDSTSAAKGLSDKWHGYSLLKSAMSYIEPIFTEMIDHERDQVEYMAIKIYSMAILYRNMNISFSKFWNEYTSMSKLMLRNFPNYRKNSYARSFKGKGAVRKFTARVIWGVVLSERAHLIKGILFIYWLIGRKKKITV